MHREARPDAIGPIETPPQKFLACQNGCGLPAEWVLTSLLRGRERPLTEALCKECLGRRVLQDD
jgi:hypothetical protein